MGSVMGFLLFTEDDEPGALNLHSRRPHTFDEAARRTGWILASHAAEAFSAARTASAAARPRPGDPYIRSLPRAIFTSLRLAGGGWGHRFRW